MRGRNRRVGTAALAAGLAVLVASPAAALPRYAARYNQKCSLCHVNPSGGGLRTLYASQDLVPNEMAWKVPKGDILDGISPKIAKNVTVGTDVRTIHDHSNLRVQSTDFFEMQADVYLSFQMGETTSLYYDGGMSGNKDVFGIAYLLPVTAGYVKVGRFLPSYGWTFDDHTAFVRSDLGYAPPGNRDVGVEVGASPGHLDAAAALTNGDRGQILSGDSKYAATANATYRFRVGRVGAALGVEGYRAPGTAGTFRSGGAHGYVSWHGVSLVSQADVYRSDPGGAVGPTGFVTSHELSVLLRKGLEAIATADYDDPDRFRATGSVARWGGGVSVMPSPFVVLQAIYRRTTYRNGVALSGPDFYQTIAQVHFLY
ncbi:MAG: hypothetical protein ACM3JJ_04010 [Hyphomicrobiales bacterium]